MKKLIFLFACIALTALTGCKEEKVSNPETLAGTKWAYTQQTAEYTVTSDLEFKGSAFVLKGKFIYEDGNETFSETGTYTYTGSTVTLIPDSDKTDLLSGMVDGDTITFDDDGDIIVFTRI